MEANLFLLLAAGVLCGSGVYLMLDRAMTKMLLGILLLGNGANLLLLQAGGQAGSPPIDGRETAQYGENIADPLAQGMILTASTATAPPTSLRTTRKIPQSRPWPPARATPPRPLIMTRPTTQPPAAPLRKATPLAQPSSRNP